MKLVKQAGELYAALLKEQGASSPAVLGFRTFMVQHFQQAGMKAADEIDARRKAGTLDDDGDDEADNLNESKPAYAKGFKAPLQQQPRRKPSVQYQRFQHPDAGLPPNRTSDRGQNRVRRALQQDVSREIDGDDADDLGLDNPSTGRGQNTGAASGKAGTGGTSAKGGTKEVTTARGAGAGAAAGDKGAAKKGTEEKTDTGDASSEKVKNLTKSELEDLGQMQPSVVVKHYEDARIRAYLDSKSIKYNPEASPRQVAAILTNHLKRKTD